MRVTREMRRGPAVELDDLEDPALHGVAWGDLQLGRRPGFQQLAGASTYTSYGRVGHSAARYNVPGRAIIDRSNTFLYSKANLQGCIDLVSRSWKPLQELGWASIGNVLTAIQIREALSRDVLVPWNAWRPEFFKSMRTLHEADRGGFTFAPEVGLHDDVHELTFRRCTPTLSARGMSARTSSGVTATRTARTCRASGTASATTGATSWTCSSR
jgi:DNA polymerase I